MSEQPQAAPREPSVSGGEDEAPALEAEPNGNDAETADAPTDGTDEGGFPEQDAPPFDAGDVALADRPLGKGLEGARRAAAWAPSGVGVPPGPTLSFGFNLEKVPGQGEDSDPIVRDGRDLGLVGVFDGMGGAGGTVYETSDGPRTGAYLASRVARDVVEERMLALLDPEWNLEGPRTARELQRSVKRALAETLEGLHAPASGLRSRMLRALPTTMALMALQRRDPRAGRWAGHVFWSGDSRVYVLHPAAGASQLTRDDLRDAGDALVNLRHDSVVSNAMSADTDFVVHHRQVELTAPFLAVAATDGCFGYVRTPIHFEHLLLTSLQEATGLESWSALLQQRISAITGDDAALAVLGVGASYEQFQELFARRTEDLQQRCIAPLDALEAEVSRAEQVLAETRRRHAALQTSLWAAYKPQYERYLGREEQR